jgi:transcriptional regulator GlxA family with amidase domain
MVTHQFDVADVAAVPGKSGVSVAFILCPHFTLMPFAAIVDTLRLAADDGDGSRQIHCRWTIVGPSLDPVEASCGIKVQPWETFGDPSRFDYVVVVGGLLHRGPTSDEATLDYLREAARKGVTLVGVCTGSFTLIRAGLMDGHRCCVSWFHYHDLIDEFPDVTPIADQLFVVNGRRITCAGGAGALDLAAWIVERHLGRAFAQKSLHIMVVDRARSPNTPQPQPPTVPLVQSDRVRRAMLLIEQYLSEPLDACAIASRVNISRRQLERLFRREVGMSLQAFSRAMRLQYGLWLLANSPRTIAEIAYECGFADPSHFNRLFRAAFGKAPSCARGEGREAMLALLTKVRGGIPRGQAGRDELVDAFHAPVRLPGVARPYV